MKYTESHEWIEVEGSSGRVGITKYAQKELGDIVHIELPRLGSMIEVGDEVAVLESTKAAADIYSPVSGKVLAVNERLKEDLSLLNRDPEGEGWLFQIKLSDRTELKVLYDQERYLELVGDESFS
ncbi:MAG: glycine cleavage system protein GcvH [Chlamydiae bacterium]|nr:glycine cleavage system protein GcvH [Chlamydiota bacterium]